MPRVHHYGRGHFIRHIVTDVDQVLLLRNHHFGQGYRLIHTIVLHSFVLSATFILSRVFEILLRGRILVSVLLGIRSCTFFCVPFLISIGTRLELVHLFSLVFLKHSLILNYLMILLEKVLELYILLLFLQLNLTSIPLIKLVL